MTRGILGLFMEEILLNRRFKVKRSRAGLGLFAEEPIKKGAFLIEYKGPIISNEEADEKGGKYLFERSSRTTIDGSNRANTARYINHSCVPNCKAYIEKGRINFYAVRNINTGDELHVHYGKEYFDEYIQPYGCKCRKCTSDEGSSLRHP